MHNSSALAISPSNTGSNLRLVHNLTSASAFALLVSFSPSAVTQELPQRNPVTRYENYNFPKRSTNASKNLKVTYIAGACKLGESVHTPDSSARMSEGGTMNRALTTLASLRQLADGWAGYESKGPESRTIADAEVFAQVVLAEPAILEPIISPACDGEVNFFWENQHITLDLGFYGDGFYSFYAKTEDGEEFFGDHQSIDSMLPTKIVEHLLKA